MLFSLRSNCLAILFGLPRLASKSRNDKINSANCNKKRRICKIY
ncbi:hypothetical protein ACWIUD_07300 [Helicobacter sp. 23-1044]